MRVTGPLLDILELLLRAWQDDEEIHGWAIMKAVKRSGPTTYNVLDRIEDAGWATGTWENQHPETGRPRRRFYRLTPTGVAAARELLAARRPQSRQGRLLPLPDHALLVWVRSVGLGGAR
jgi:DNA-binding PadR family transcriptional regulator